METHLRHVASLLRLHREVAGLAAYGWLYDPELAAISPHLGYLRRRPLERGAISCAGTRLTSRLRTRPRNRDAQAPLRRRRVHAGRPQILWLRHDILSWADRTRQTPAESPDQLRRRPQPIPPAAKGRH